MNFFAGIWQSIKSAFSGPGNIKQWPVLNNFFAASAPTLAGTRVNEQFALGVSSVWSAVTLLADAIMTTRISVVQIEGDTETQLPDHPTARMFRRGANTDTSIAMLLYTMQAHNGIWSNAYVEIIRNARNEATALYPLMPTETWPLVDADLPYDVIIGYDNTHNGKTRKLNPEDVLHVRGHTPNGVEGYPILNAMRESIGLALAQEGFGARFFRNDSRSGGFITVPNARIDPKSRKALANSLASGDDDEGEGQGGLDNAWKVKVLEGGAKYVPTTITPNEGQFLESRGFQVAEVARFYRVPLVKLDATASTAWGSGIEQLEINFVTDTLLPLVKRYEDEMTRKLIPPRQREQGVRVRLNIAERIMGDMQARGEYYSSGINAGWMTRNEARAKEGLNPIDGLDEPLTPVNMQSGTDANNEDILPNDETD